MSIPSSSSFFLVLRCCHHPTLSLLGMFGCMSRNNNCHHHHPHRPPVPFSLPLWCPPNNGAMYRIYSEGYIIIEQTEFSFSLRYFYGYIPEPPDPIHEAERRAKAQYSVPQYNTSSVKGSAAAVGHCQTKEWW